MLEELESDLSFTLPSKTELEVLTKNFSYFVNDFYDDAPTSDLDPEYEQFLADVWQWKRSVEERRREDMEAANAESESLPSYTIVSGLPSYDEAMEQLKRVKELTSSSSSSKDQTTSTAKTEENARTLASMQQIQTISVIELFQLYKNYGQEGNVKV